MKTLILFILLAPLSLEAKAQSFSCSFGRPACLDYGDKVCSSMGKCVTNDAVCFDSFQCDYEGFTCKSNLTDCADEYGTLQDKYNNLVSEYNDLLDASRALTSELEIVRSELSSKQEDLDDFARCVSFTDTLEDAQNCDP